MRSIFSSIVAEGGISSSWFDIVIDSHKASCNKKFRKVLVHSGSRETRCVMKKILSLVNRVETIAGGGGGGADAVTLA